MGQIRNKVELLLSAFLIISQRFDFTCETGRFEGMLYLFASGASENPFIQSLPLKDRLHALMKIMTEMYFMDVFKGTAHVFMDPHPKMSFREALGGMYGINGKEIRTPIVRFDTMLKAATTYGINTAAQFSGDYWLYSSTAYSDSPQDPKVQDACRRLMRLIMSPQNVINKLDANPLCHATLEKFLREVYHMSDEKIPVLLANADTRRQIIADMLFDQGYLLKNET
jgi:hypothetical protein